MNDEFVELVHNTCIMKSLELWKQIATFLKRTTIYNKTDPQHIQDMNIKFIQEGHAEVKKTC